MFRTIVHLTDWW